MATEPIDPVAGRRLKLFVWARALEVFGERLRPGQMRGKRGLATMTGVSAPTLYRYFNGEPLHERAGYVLARSLGVSLRRLQDERLGVRSVSPRDEFLHVIDELASGQAGDPVAKLRELVGRVFDTPDDEEPPRSPA